MRKRKDCMQLVKSKSAFCRTNRGQGLLLIILSFLLLSSCAGLTTKISTPSLESVLSKDKTSTSNVVCHTSKTQELNGGFTVVGEFPVWTTITKDQWYPGRLQKPYEGSIGKGVWFVNKGIQGELRVTGRQIDGDGKILFFNKAGNEKDNQGNEIIYFLDAPTEVFIVKNANLSNYLSPIPDGYSGNITGYITTKPGCYQLSATIQNYKIEIDIESIKGG